MLKAPAYVIISLVFFILIGVGFAYSYFFYPNAHPVDCVIKAYTGKDCPTCGFSRAFSYYTHFQFEGKGWKSTIVAGFSFLFQFLLRLLVVFYYYASGKIFNWPLITGDILISISLFLLAFLPIILKF